jgi:peptidoglycan/LPS O-acetylase OafA/YrhL
MRSHAIGKETELPRATASTISSAWMPGKLSAASSASLDLMRAVAACAVMFGHLRTLFFVDFQHLASKSWPFEVLYFLTGFGHQAVMVFFVLSGFLISTSVIRNHILGEWSWREYAINRATRLYVVLIPGLLLGLLWDTLGSRLSAANGLYSHALLDLGYAVPLQNLTIANFFGNLFFLQTILCHTFGSNGPLWSLSNEFWYYVLFPVALGAGLAWASRRYPTALLLTGLAIGVCFFMGFALLAGFLIWLAGCTLVLFFSRTRLRSQTGIILIFWFSVSLLGAALFAARRSWLAATASDLAVGLAFAFFLFAVLQMNAGENSRLYPAVAHKFAGFSYSLYILHFPFLLFLRARLVPPDRWQPTAAHLLQVAMVAAICLVYAWSISLFTEAKTSAARKWVRHIFA